jgi:hypothetical protein
MIISHAHRFIFIKTAKTASTSIEIFLSPQCGPKDVVTPIKPPVEGHEPRNFEGFKNHMPASLVRENVPGDIWQGYFKFCVERNPWDKVLSHYHMQVYRGGNPLSLDEYLAQGRFPINYLRYTDAAGAEVIVDRVLRYENLDAELAQIFPRLGLRFEGSLGVRAKSEYRTDRTPYQSVFNPEQRRIVVQAFAKEIELHGYRFDEPAAKLNRS